jgi:RNA polymerase III subunit Rpc25
MLSYVVVVVVCCCFCFFVFVFHYISVPGTPDGDHPKWVWKYQREDGNALDMEIETLDRINLLVIDVVYNDFNEAHDGPNTLAEYMNTRPISIFGSIQPSGLGPVAWWGGDE